MKKVLLATSALIATAGMASADINLSGGARLGLVYNNGVAATNDKIRFEKRFTINVDGSGETDGGLSFGGRIRLRSDEGDASGGISSANVYLGNDTWRVTVGNTDGAMLNRVGYFQGSVGLTGLGYRNVSFNIGTSSWGLASFSSRGNAGSIVRLDFNVGDFGVSLSTDNRGAYVLKTAAHEDSIAVAYNFGDWKVAAGYADEGVADIWSLSAVGSIGDFGVGLGYSDRSTVGSKVTLEGSYNFGSTSVTAFVAKTSEDTLGSAGIGAAGSETEYGIGFTHSLGGATLAGGIVRDYTKNTQADFGVRFKF